MHDDVDSDRYRPKVFATDITIRLTQADVASLPSYGRTRFDAGRHEVRPELMANGLKWILDSYLAGMHVGYGISAFVEPTTFLLALRRVADSIYDAIRRQVGVAVIHDVSPGNAPYAAAIDALFPDRHDAPHEDVIAPAAPVVAGAPIFVVGVPRSGTTWLQSLLASHPAVAGPDQETGLFTSFRDLLGNEALRAWVSRDQIVAGLRGFADTLFTQFLAEHAPRATRLLEKTPNHANFLPTIADVYPEAAIIAIIRDGRDVVRSILDVPFGTDDATAAARAWVRSTTAVEAFAPTSPRIRVVRYEQLRADPVGEVTALLEWLDLAPDDAVRTTLRERAGTRVSQHGSQPEWHALSARDLRTVYRVGGERLVALGYCTDDELRAVRRQPAYWADAAMRVRRRLVRNR